MPAWSSLNVEKLSRDLGPDSSCIDPSQSQASPNPIQTLDSTNPIPWALAQLLTL